jgi:hypothetical protein
VRPWCSAVKWRVRPDDVLAPGDHLGNDWEKGAVTETLELQHVGVTVSGAVELLSARPITGSQDRALLASLVVATLNS